MQEILLEYNFAILMSFQRMVFDSKEEESDHQNSTVAQSGHLYFQTPPVTEFTTCETAISYLTQNSLPHNLQCCRRHKIYHLQYNDVLSHTEFTTCETAISYLTQNLPPHNLQCCRRHKIYHLQYNNLLSHTGFFSSYGNTLRCEGKLARIRNSP